MVGGRSRFYLIDFGSFFKFKDFDNVSFSFFVLGNVIMVLFNG